MKNYFRSIKEYALDGSLKKHKQLNSSANGDTKKIQSFKTSMTHAFHIRYKSAVPKLFHLSYPKTEKKTDVPPIVSCNEALYGILVQNISVNLNLMKIWQTS